MKILQLIPSLGSGGAERFVTDLCNGLAQTGADVCLCIIQNPDEKDFGFYKNELDDKVKFVSLRRAKGFSVVNVMRLRKVIKEFKPDVIHAHLGALLYLYFLKMLSPRRKFFYTIHNLADRACPHILFRLVNYLYFCSGLIKVITISEECDNSYRRFYKLSNGNKIPNGRNKALRTAQFQTVANEVEVYKNNKNDTVFVHVARYHEQKNQSLLIQVFNKLYQIRKDFVLLIIGDWNHDANAQKLLSQACEVIHYLGTKGNVADYLYLADAFCLTSVYEGLPISLLEALACGCVPICTPAGGVVDVITDGETGYISGNITVSDYLNSIEYYLDHKLRITRASLVELFDTNYSIEIAVQNHLSLFEH